MSAVAAPLCPPLPPSQPCQPIAPEIGAPIIPPSRYSEDDCSICFEALTDWDVYPTDQYGREDPRWKNFRPPVWQLACGHQFHCKCIVGSLNAGNHDCPLCRRRILNANEVIESCTRKMSELEAEVEKLDAAGKETPNAAAGAADGAAAGANRGVVGPAAMREHAYHAAFLFVVARGEDPHEGPEYRAFANEPRLLMTMRPEEALDGTGRVRRNVRHRLHVPGATRLLGAGRGPEQEQEREQEQEHNPLVTAVRGLVEHGVAVRETPSEREARRALQTENVAAGSDRQLRVLATIATLASRVQGARMHALVSSSPDRGYVAFLLEVDRSNDFGQAGGRPARADDDPLHRWIPLRDLELAGSHGIAGLAIRDEGESFERLRQQTHALMAQGTEWTVSGDVLRLVPAIRALLRRR